MDTRKNHGLNSTLSQLNNPLLPLFHLHPHSHQISAVHPPIYSQAYLSRPQHITPPTLLHHGPWLPPLHHLLCTSYPLDHLLPTPNQAHWACLLWVYIFYLSKILEFMDTLLIILSNSIQRLSFLHVYHHSTVVIMCYIWLQISQTLFPVMLFTNASVHVLMYAYYLSCALGVRPKWKKLVTDVQIMQFYSSFLVLIVNYGTAYSNSKKTDTLNNVEHDYPNDFFSTYHFRY
ncbi:hypothetical protein PIB30_044623 [Stylosanthes scabra]|uniref:very-long-chain 3-oxoacyl-CoA synthase n=1 Tax=Stylosanthes scabra TaxID=79078 RepID=A0ABU6UEJ6_9FABA|nr:hypothetical protein [Stylosanthes scabra]